MLRVDKMFEQRTNAAPALVMLAALACAVSARAQPLVSGPIDDLPLTITARTTEGVSEKLTLKNRAEQPIHAYVVTVELRSRKSGKVIRQHVQRMDLHYFAGQGAIDPGGTTEIVFGAAPAGLDVDLEASVQAVILFDGKAYGAEYWIDSVALMRDSTRGAIDEILDEIDRSRPIASLQALSNTISDSRNLVAPPETQDNSPEKTAITTAYDTAIRLLNEPGAWSEDEADQKVDSVVKQLTAWRQRISSARPITRLARWEPSSQ